MKELDKNKHESLISREIDNNTLNKVIAEAKAAYHNAHAPYSNFHVGAAALTSSGAIVKGCNVENASYGLTVCAERNCISHAVVNGNKKFEFIVIYTEQEALTPPCGACRQVISEFFLPDAFVIAVNHLNEKKYWTVQGLLPDAFTPQYLLDE